VTIGKCIVGAADTGQLDDGIIILAAGIP